MLTFQDYLDLIDSSWLLQRRLLILLMGFPERPLGKKVFRRSQNDGPSFFECYGLFFVHVTAKSMCKLVLNHQSEYGIKCLLLE